MIPREVLIELAKLQHQARQLQDEFLTELEDMTKALEARYFPRLQTIQKSMAEYRQRIADHQCLSEEIKWRIYDRENHDTPIDVTKLMKKAQLRETNKRRTYEIK